MEKSQLPSQIGRLPVTCYLIYLHNEIWLFENRWLNPFLILSNVYIYIHFKFMQPLHTSQNACVNLLNDLLITSHPRPQPQRDSAPSRDGLSCHTPGHLWTYEAGKNGESWRISLLACHVWLIGLQKELAWNLRVMSKQLGTTAMYSERFEVLQPPSPTFLDFWQAISSNGKKTAI